jgi:membrane-anchored glycerophosphoryl diester phosphodiesterase (GDPDase)
MANGKLHERIKATPEWIKLTLPFIIGLLASPVVQKLFEELYQMNGVLCGNVTYVNVVHYLDTSGGTLLYYLVLTIVLVALFAVLALIWSKDREKTEDAIQEIKDNVKDIGSDIKKLMDKK